MVRNTEITQFFHSEKSDYKDSTVDDTVLNIKVLESQLQLEKDKLEKQLQHQNDLIEQTMKDELNLCFKNLQEFYGEEHFNDAICDFLDYDIIDEEDSRYTDTIIDKFDNNMIINKDEWKKHRPNPCRVYKNGIKGVQKNGNNKWKFSGFSYTFNKHIRKTFDHRAQAVAYAKKVWSSYPAITIPEFQAENY